MGISFKYYIHTFSIFRLGRIQVLLWILCPIDLYIAIEIKIGGIKHLRNYVEQRLNDVEDMCRKGGRENIIAWSCTALNNLTTENENSIPHMQTKT